MTPYRDVKAFRKATKAQCLQTDYVPNEKTRLVFDLEMEGDSYYTGTAVLFYVPDKTYRFTANFGGGASEGSTLCCWPWKYYGMDGYSGVENKQFSLNVIKSRNTLSFGRGRCDWGSEGRDIHANPTATEYVFQNPLFILGSSVSSPFTGWNVKLYGFKIFEGGDGTTDDENDRVGGDGGDGILCAITGASHCYGSGGGGAGYNKAGTGGRESGGAGGLYHDAGADGIDGLGGGGGGGGYLASGGAGGSGIVILRFERRKNGLSIILR